MYTLSKTVPARRVVLEQAPLALMAVGVSEVLYRFHSFTLECLAFLATWYALDWAVAHARGRRQGSPSNG